MSSTSGDVHSPLLRFAAPAVFALGFLAPFLLGSVHNPVRIMWALLSGLVLLGSAAHAWKTGSTFRLSAWSLALSVAAAVSLLQVIPVPPALLETVASSAHGFRLETAKALGVGLGASPLTLTPTLTYGALSRWLTLLFLSLSMSYWAFATRAGARTRITWVAKGLSLSALAQLLIGGANHLFAKGTILGWQTSRGVVAVITGTFVNGNHAGTFLAMGCCAALGLGLSRERFRSAWLVLAAILLAGTAGTGSRGALGAVLIAVMGLGLQVALRRIRRTKETHTPRRSSSSHLLALGTGVIAMLGAALILAMPNARDQLLWEYGGQWGSKVGNYAKLGAAIKELPLLGYGADSFAHISPYYLKLPGHRMSFIESDPLQLVLDFGWIPALVIVGLVLWGMFSLARPRTDGRELGTSAVGLAYALLVFVISGAVSFNTVVLGLALPALAIAEVLVRGKRRGVVEVGTKRFAPVVALLACVMGAALVLWQTRSDEEQVAGKSHGWEKSVQIVTGLPTDGHRMALVARQRLSDNPGPPDKKTLALAKRAAKLAPGDPSVHFASILAARRLSKPKRLERSYREALAVLPNVPTRFWRPFTEDLRDGEARAAAMPKNKPHLWKALAVHLWRKKDNVGALGFTAALQALYPEHEMALELASGAARRAGEPVLAEIHAQALLSLAPEKTTGFLLLAHAYLNQKQPGAAWETYHRGIKKHPESVPLRFGRVSTMLQHPAHVPSKAGRFTAEDLQYLRRHVFKPTQRARYHYYASLHASNKGNLRDAERQLDRACKLVPTSALYCRGGKKK